MQPEEEVQPEEEEVEQGSGDGWVLTHIEKHYISFSHLGLISAVS